MATWGDAHYYEAHSAPQRTGARGAIPLLMEATEVWLAGGQRPATEAITLADYGCAGGANSLEPLGAVVRALRDGGREDPIVIANVDLPSNDFSAVFNTYAEHSGAYAESRGGVFPVAIGRSFYQQVLPPLSLDIGWSSHSIHWLSKRPPPPDSDGHMLIHMAPPGAREPWAAQAGKDWTDFLLARAAEMRPGGQLVLELAAADDLGTVGSEELYDVADRAFAVLARRGLISQEEIHDRIVPVYCRTREELEAPFQDPAVASLLRLEQLILRQIDDPLRQELQAWGDSDAYARAVANTLRAFTESRFFGGNDGPDGPSLAPDLAERYYRVVADLVKAKPGGLSNSWLVADLHISRTIP